MAEVFIPDTPLERQYACPFCSKGVHCFRIGDSSSYWVMDATDINKQHKCGSGDKTKSGPIPIKLLGYKPPKEQK